MEPLNGQAVEMLDAVGKALRTYRIQHAANYTGIVHLSVEDMQAIFDEKERRDALKYNKKARKRKLTTGDQFRILGVRIMADRMMNVGEVALK